MNATMCLFMFVSLILSGVFLAKEDIYNDYMKTAGKEDKKS